MTRIKHYINLAATIIILLLSFQTKADDPYTFDWRNSKDMRGAFWICGIVAFIPGDCPKVLTKCWLPPLTKLKFPSGITSKCLGIPDFSSDKGDIEAGIARASSAVNIDTPDLSGVDIDGLLALEHNPATDGDINYDPNRQGRSGRAGFSQPSPGVNAPTFSKGPSIYSQQQNNNRTSQATQLESGQTTQQTVKEPCSPFDFAGECG
jgi:hypothetical protein